MIGLDPSKISKPPKLRLATGDRLEGRFPRRFVPGYDQPVPPGQKPFALLEGLALS